jgi:hypothetical protein
VGEGPASFTDYFSQQDRWSRGTDEVLVRRFWRTAHRLGPRALVHYLLLTCYYPTAAIAWILGAVNAILYFALGAGGVIVPAHLWLMLYVDAAALQIGLYFFNRRHNISPHEKKGSAGVEGMLISALSAPIYAASLAAVALRRSNGFVTTPKGNAGTRDTAITFRKHMLWALVFGVPLLFSFLLGHHHFSMRAWSFASLIVCLMPVGIWRIEQARERRAERAAEPKPERREQPAPVPTAPPEPIPLRPVPDLPRVPVPVRPLEPAAAAPAPSWPAERERRMRHQVVRFDRRTVLSRDHHGALERTPNGAVRELRPGRRKAHVVVRFDPPQGHQFGQQPDPEWQVYDRAEA